MASKSCREQQRIRFGSTGYRHAPQVRPSLPARLERASSPGRGQTVWSKGINQCILEPLIWKIGVLGTMSWKAGHFLAYSSAATRIIDVLPPNRHPPLSSRQNRPLPRKPFPKENRPDSADRLEGNGGFGRGSLRRSDVTPTMQTGDRPDDFRHHQFGSWVFEIESCRKILEFPFDDSDILRPSLMPSLRLM